MNLAMSRVEREAFLADVHVAVVSVAQPGRAPLAVPIWYAYEPGAEVRMVTGRTSRKAALIRAAGRVTLCVQTEQAPYKYVSVEGSVSFGDVDVDRDLRPLACRYLGAEMADVYLQMTAAERERTGEVLIRVHPQRWSSVDYTKMVQPA